MEIFTVPVVDRHIVYAPLAHTTALVNGEALALLQAGLRNDRLPAAGTGTDLPLPVKDLLEQLGASAAIPAARTGPVNDPIFLGIIPTRGCNMACRYCDFAAPKQSSPVMTLDTARAAVDAYLDLMVAAGNDRVEVHFFGGEPFCAPQIVQFVVEYARYRASEHGWTVHFEATTNGFYSAERCRWIADTFDTIVLSLDGPPDIQDHHRAAITGGGTSDVVQRNAAILSDGPVDLVIRACVTGDTAPRLPQIAGWIADNFRPSTVCFETLTPSPLAEQHALIPPDPWTFARVFDEAAQVLAPHGIRTAISTVDLGKNRVTFCPVGHDALIVTPSGRVNTCYLLSTDWQSRGLDMQIGKLDNGSRRTQFRLDPAAVQAARDLTVYQKRLCDNCLCRYHCAGGCPVNHATTGPAGHYDALCIQTRLITVAQLLRDIGQHALVETWFADRAELDRTATLLSDRLQVLNE
ncbi:MAG: radical SAM protein [Anaerolineae bacterium]|nr:radical SAM protein [Anaerolineae bacterium]